MLSGSMFRLRPSTTAHYAFAGVAFARVASVGESRVRPGASRRVNRANVVAKAKKQPLI